ncbi:multiheme c-type cytochrome [Aliiglaciecola sp. SL4]|uniref:multiheme c-type cytochrome n=1 Tax=Aliiglaciecola sp. SL4 TaxID=3239806 RepID=UPI00355C55EA
MYLIKNVFFVLVISCIFTANCTAESLAQTYIGSNACESCHQEEHQQWQTSDHHNAMQAPNSTSVLGDFSNKTVEFHNIKTRFFTKDDSYFVETTNKQGERQTFPVIYTFGFDPLQQYILDTGNGHMQAFNIAWDTRPKEAGGQRWYHLQPDESINNEHPFFWQRHFQNWNSRCAECHTTGFEKNYKIESNSFATQFAEATVGCESCHGPAAKHQSQAENGKFDSNKGFSSTLARPPVFGFAKNDPIANLISGGNKQFMQQCADCHSRRLPIEDITQVDKNTSDYHNLNSLNLISPNLYFDDGQILDEVFVVGSFLQSKMAEAGVTCSNCHNPHTGKLKFNGNQTCTQCHSVNTYDTPEHHHHKSEEQGAQCVNCHMPERTYMQVDDRRDHSFVLPNAEISAQINSPNACLSCHQQQDLTWVDKQLKSWHGNDSELGAVKSSKTSRTAPHWSQIHLLSGRQQIKFAQQQLPNASALVGGKLLQIINQQPSQESINLALQQLNSDDPLLRRAALDILRLLPPNQAYQYLSPLLQDPVKSVRFHATSILTPWLSQLPKSMLPELAVALDEYKSVLMLTADFPTSQLTLAQLALAQGDTVVAQKHFEQAQIIAPNMPSVMLAFADFWRIMGEPQKELALLQRAVEIHSDFADVLHQYGLYWVRNKDYNKATNWLVKASELGDAQPYYAYVAATALDSIQRTNDAVNLLLQANKRWPKQTNLLYSLALYSDKSNNQNAMKTALAELRWLMPDNPQVQQWVLKSNLAH